MWTRPFIQIANDILLIGQFDILIPNTNTWKATTHQVCSCNPCCRSVSASIRMFRGGQEGTGSRALWSSLLRKWDRSRYCGKTVTRQMCSTVCRCEHGEHHVRECPQILAFKRQESHPIVSTFLHWYLFMIMPTHLSGIECRTARISLSLWAIRSCQSFLDDS